MESLYNVVQKYENAYIITSCRTSDKNAFIKIESKYNIVSYEVSEISEIELNLLKNQYQVIKEMSENKRYADLLRTPFYINIIIKNSMRTIYLLKIDEVLPEIMIAVKEILDYNKDNLKDKFDGDTKTIKDRMITKAFVDFSDAIKRDNDLIEAYENIEKIKEVAKKSIQTITVKECKV